MVEMGDESITKLGFGDWGQGFVLHFSALLLNIWTNPEHRFFQ